MKHYSIKKAVVLLSGALASLTILPSCSTQGPATQAISSTSSASKIRSASKAALNDLYAQNPQARQLGSRAKGILVFPEVTKAGLGIGIQSGQGALFLPNGTAGYYQTTGASYGLQAGAQKFGYALLLMDNNALQQLYDSRGWEVGSAPSLVVVDEGISKSLSTTTIQNGTYAFFFNQRGLMAGLGFQGTKVTRIEPGP
jgi:lipid-binding SYLF domain-containing protein